MSAGVVRVVVTDNGEIVARDALTIRSGARLAALNLPLVSRNGIFPKHNVEIKIEFDPAVVVSDDS